jgi:hypothetical protein
MALTTTKTDLDGILLNTAPILTSLNSTNINSIKADLDIIDTPFFNVSYQLQRPTNTTVYSANACVNTSTTVINLPAWVLPAKFWNQVVQIDEINLSDNNTNATLTPTLYITGSSYINGTQSLDNNIPLLYYDSGSISNMEVIVMPQLIRLPGNAGNENVLKSAITNLNIKINTSNTGLIYFTLVTSQAFTPISGQYIILQIKGRIC